MDSNVGSGLRGRIGSLQLFSLAFGAILGAGWIIALGQWLRQAGPLGTAIGFFAGAAVLSLISLCYAELGTRYPAAGGEVVYAQKLFGEGVSYYTGWFLATSYVAACAFEAISIGWISEALVPGAQGPVIYHLLGADVHAGSLGMGLVAIIATAMINYRGVHSATGVQDALTAALIIAALIFIGAGLLAGRAENLQPAFVRDVSGSMWKGIAAIFVAAPFWFSGFGVVAQALGETANPAQRRQLAGVLLAAINASCLFYVLVMLAASIAVPRSELLSMSLPAAGAFVRALHSVVFGKLVLCTGLLGLLIALNAIFYSATRVLYTLGAASQLPAWLGHVDARSGSPSAAILLVALLSILGTALGQGAIAPLVDSTAIALSGIYLLVCWGTCRVHWRSDRRHTGAMAVAVIATIVTLLMGGTALVTPWLSPHQGLPTELRMLGIATLLGIALRAFRRRDRA